MATKLTTVKRQSYTVSEKLRIIQFAEQHGNRAAEREFGVSESNAGSLKFILNKQPIKIEKPLQCS